MTSDPTANPAPLGSVKGEALPGDALPTDAVPASALRALFQRLPFGVSILRAAADGDQTKLTFVEANPQASKESGMDLSTIAGLTVADAFPTGADGPIPRAWQRAVDTDELQQMPEVPYGDARHPDGWFRTFGVPLTDGYVASVYQNITKEKASKTALQRSNRDLEAFASIIAHDMNAPLRSIRAFIDLILDEHAHQLDGDGQQYLDMIASTAEHLSAMVNDALEFARLSSAEPDRDEIAVKALVESTRQLLAEEIKESAAVVVAGGEEVIRADPGMILRVLQNIVSNSIRYRGEAPPRVQITVAREGSNWVVACRDNGIGIREDVLDRAVRPSWRMQRLDDGGTGMGLTICKRIVELHGGDLWVQSEYGRSTTVHFSLPDRG